jgi:hypothetical protein
MTGIVPAQAAIEPGRYPARSPLKIKSMNLIQSDFSAQYIYWY